MKIIEYLDKNKIDWFYINLNINKWKKKELCNYTKIENGHELTLDRPSVKDFENIHLVKERQSHHYESDYIAIDTSKVYQIDVDTVDEEGNGYVPEEYKTLELMIPYYLSSTKKLPHFFILPEKKSNKMRFDLEKNVEILSGQWSYASVESEVINCEKPIQQMAKELMYNSSEREERESPNIKNEINKKEIEYLIKKCISKERANGYSSWIEIGMILYNIDSSIESESYKLWDELSQKSAKYDKYECEKQWLKFKEGKLKVGTLYYYGKNDNKEEYKKMISMRVKYDVKNADASHVTLSKILYKMYKGDYVCATSDGKLWYYYNGLLWKEDNDQLKFKDIIIDGLLEQFNIAYQIEDIEAPISDSASEVSSKKLTVAQKQINKVRVRLRDYGFIQNLVKSCVRHFYDELFLKRLDANPNLLGFENGVYYIKEKKFVKGNSMDYVSLSVGYDYKEEKDVEKYDKVIAYLKKLHPVKENLEYYVKTMSRQLYGDSGSELFHFHCGYLGSAANGKTKSFEISKLVLGDYIQTFDVSYLVNVTRKQGGAPNPEMGIWRGRRMLYCSEPNRGETINSGILKAMTGGEAICYRILFSNIFNQYIPQFKIHIMTNDLPQLDGSDEGVKRRIRALPYVSKFVIDETLVDEKNNVYLADSEITYSYREDDNMKMEYMRYLLDNYEHEWRYTMSIDVKEASVEYLSENDSLGMFVEDNLERCDEEFVTLKTLKDLVKSCDYLNINGNILKTMFEKVLGIKCVEQKRINNVKYKNVFVGFGIKCLV
jgi:phage/plasmid-associated DNA primase